jgi:hypothetical protein
MYTNPVRQENALLLRYETKQLMLFRETMAALFKNDTKHMNTLRGWNRLLVCSNHWCLKAHKIKTTQL